MFLGIGLAITQQRAGGGYSAAASQFFARVTDPGETRKNLYAAMIDALVVGGVWTKLDGIWVMAAADAATARTNLKTSSYSLTEVLGPTFTVDRGYAGNASTRYLDTGFNPATAGGVFTQNSAHVSLWNRTSRAGATMASGNTTGSVHVYIYPFYTDNKAYMRVNAADVAITVASSVGHYLGNRSGAGATQQYKDGASIGSGSVASGALVSQSLFIGAIHSGTIPIEYSSDQFAAFSVGSSLSAGEVSTLYTALLTYLQAVGAA